MVSEALPTVLGKRKTLKQDIWQIPFLNIEQMVHKMQRYSTLGASKIVRQKRSSSIFKALLRGFWSFIRLYFFKLGFLDGRAGFIIALGTFEGTFYRYAKAAEKQHGWDLPPKIK